MTEDTATSATTATTPAAKPIFAEVVLPSGKHAVLEREPLGHDMERAFEVVSDPNNMVTLGMALFAVSAGKLDGKRVTYEDLRHSLSGLDAYRIACWTSAGYEVMRSGKGQEPPASPL